jgi:hypothetical protein
MVIGIRCVVVTSGTRATGLGLQMQARAGSALVMTEVAITEAIGTESTAGASTIIAGTAITTAIANTSDFPEHGAFFS